MLDLPSPTGYLHIGNIRVALLNYLFAKKNNLHFFRSMTQIKKDQKMNFRFLLWKI